MKKIETINISGRVFKIEEDAFYKIINYRKDIRSYFVETEGGDEIISDIELRITELLSEILKNENRDVLNIKDIDEVINRIGEISDFDSDTERNTQNTQNNSSRRNNNIIDFRRKLFRDPKNKMLGGVCSGLAPYLGIDVTILRIIWLVSTIGIIPYIIMWIIVPEAKSNEDFKSLKNDRSWGKDKFYRSTKNKVFGGVCGGLSESINIDPVWMRIVAVLIALPFGIFSNIGRILIIPIALWYFILWFLLPRDRDIKQ